jgi:hypothetical protein
MAEEEEAAEGSPSPAPRSWRSRPASGDGRTSRIWGAGTRETQNRRGLDKTSLEAGTNAATSGAQLRQSYGSDSAFDETIRPPAPDLRNSDESIRRTNGLFSRSRLGSKIVETGKELVRKTSRGSLEDKLSPRPAKDTGSNGTWLSRRLSGRKRESSNTSSEFDVIDAEQADRDPADQPPQPDTTSPGFPSPNKSFAWQADADFTAGDLQISSSPPVRRSNTKIEDIRALEAEVNESLVEKHPPRRSNTRLDEIRALEIETALKFEEEPQEQSDDDGGARQAKPKDVDVPPRSRSASRANSRPDELRLRDIESLSRRALARARLDEFRGNDAAFTSRSPSPDIARKSIKEPVRALSPHGNSLVERTEEFASALQAQEPTNGQRNYDNIPSIIGVHAQAKPVGLSEDPETHEKFGIGHSTLQTRDEPADVLRRLAAVASPGTAPDARGVIEGLAFRDRETGGGIRQKRLSGAKSDLRHTVGFAGLSRSSSAESGLVKRGSFVNSDIDPTERIEGEMKLFAPLENQSEKGSLRAPSPEPEEEPEDKPEGEAEGETPEETPKNPKTDPLTLPTPKITGAYVDTPATVKVEKAEDAGTASVATGDGSSKQQTNGLERSSKDNGTVDAKLLRGRRDGITARQPKSSQSTGGRDRSSSRPSLSIRRRARSLSRGRAPLVNSAKPPTVKDDLLQIHRDNHIEDSTLDDIADFLGQQSGKARVSGPLEVKSEKGESDNLDRKEELEAYARMSQSLQTGLLGIRTAKQGIELLEKKVSHGDTKDHPHAAHGNSTTADPSCPLCRDTQLTASPTVTYVHLPLPRLWYRQPRFRFTLLGLVLFLTSLWYLMETWMCFLYCKPQYCYPGTPCDWSPDDPTWGYAIPVKLDQWTTGGQGKQLASRLVPEVTDWLADLWDAATGVDIATVDTSRYTWEQKRQHRRRLAKRGFAKQFAENPEDTATFSAWRAVRLAREKVESAREMGYDPGEDESIAADERV